MNPLSREESLAALAWRYFRSRGPATVRDCAAWSGMTMTHVRLGLAVALEDDPAALEQEEIDDVTFYFNPESSCIGGAGSAGRIDFIQCYDEYIMGYSASRSYLGGKAPAFPRHGDPLHVVLLDGRIAGAWRHS